MPFLAFLLRERVNVRRILLAGKSTWRNRETRSDIAVSQPNTNFMIQSDEENKGNG